MTQEGTVGALFDMAIGLEHKAAELYDRLAEKFAHEPRVAAFWREYAGEERVHAEMLMTLRSKVGSGVLNRETDMRVMGYAQQAMTVAVDKTVESIDNLDQAYELANDMEGGETNAIFEFLITEYAVAQEARAFLRVQLKEHVTKIAMHFPEGYQFKAERLNVKARD